MTQTELKNIALNLNEIVYELDVVKQFLAGAIVLSEIDQEKYSVVVSTILQNMQNKADEFAIKLDKISIELLAEK